MPFKKGDPNINRKGRPKKEMCIPDILRRILNEKDTEDQKKTKLVTIMNKVVNLAICGEKWAIEYLSDRTEGKAIERTADVTQEWKEIIKECGFWD